ncbi:hypothetical protein [Pseudoalteromonas piratica]|uniref:Uncharacterized protein n=1 Tax=Pseudoalteromonas piratica TaxID=1348114 RepID=A0A0A7ELA6_9GAMM|nr:hypothetical protein [Pseudoalteromonas piratica]AIY67323.1 hypothetical protein OM33_19985 [Pseudoalteromonas piratica]
MGNNVILSNDYEVTIASDISGGRDGIGVEVYHEGKLLLEIFRDDTKNSCEVTVYEKSVSLEVVEATIELFKKEIPLDFQS